MNLKELGNKIRQTRRTSGFTQEQLADKIGISLTAYNKIERGLTNLQFTRLLQIADCLNTDVSKLLSSNNSVLLDNSYSSISETIDEIKQDINRIIQLLGNDQ